jgi:hypothetical protein
MRRVLLAVVAGLVVGAVVSAGIATIRGGRIASPAGVATASPTPVTSPAALLYTQARGVDPEVSAALQRAAARTGSPIAYWGSDRTTLTIVIWGGMCDQELPGAIDASDPRALRVSFSVNLERGPASSSNGCLGGVAPESTYFQAPAGIPATGVVTIDVTTSASGTQSNVTILDPDQLKP